MAAAKTRFTYQLVGLAPPSNIAVIGEREIGSDICMGARPVGSVSKWLMVGGVMLCGVRRGARCMQLGAAARCDTICW